MLPEEPALLEYRLGLRCRSRGQAGKTGPVKEIFGRFGVGCSVPGSRHPKPEEALPGVVLLGAVVNIELEGAAGILHGAGLDFYPVHIDWPGGQQGEGIVCLLEG